MNANTGEHGYKQWIHKQGSMDINNEYIHWDILIQTMKTYTYTQLPCDGYVKNREKKKEKFLTYMYALTSDQTK